MKKERSFVMSELKELKNHKEVVEKLTEIFMDFQKNPVNYEIDVYLYFDTENGTATLDTFINVGGNSWLNDDHFTIYRYTGNFNWLDWYTETQEFFDTLELSEEEFKQEVIEYLLKKEELDEDEIEEFELDYGFALDYIESRDDYMETLHAAYCETIEEQRYETSCEAERVISEWEKPFFNGEQEF